MTAASNAPHLLLASRSQSRGGVAGGINSCSKQLKSRVNRRNMVPGITSEDGFPQQFSLVQTTS